MTRYRPDYRWQIDWDGEGAYSNAYSDVSAKMLTYDVFYGCNPALSSDHVSVATALGTLVLSNDDGRYDADSPAQLVDEVKLRRINEARLLADGEVLWSGKCEPEVRDSTEIGAPLVWNLIGKAEGQLTRGDRTMDLQPGTIVSVANAIATGAGISFAVAGDQPTGLIYWTGSWIQALDLFGLYAGGWVLETKTGDWIFRRWADSPKLPLAGTIRNSFGPIGPVIAERIGHTRNHAVCQAWVWQAETGDKVLSYNSVIMGPNQERWVTLRFEAKSNHRADSWPTSTAGFRVSDTSNFTVLGFRRISDQQYIVRIRSSAFSGASKSVTVSAVGRTSLRRKTSERVVEVTDNQTQAVFGRRTLEIPEWFPSDYEGVNTFTYPWLRLLSQPPQHLQVTYSEWLDTVQDFRLLTSACQPGNAVDFSVPLENRTVRQRSMVLAVRLRGGQDLAPTREVFAIARRDAPTTPLEVTVDAIADTTVQVTVGVPNPRGQTIYGRYRTRD